MEYFQSNYFLPRKEIDILEDTEKEYKVFAYCRVSTDKTDQRNSLASQQDFFDMVREGHDNWKSFRLFSDEGISGTSLNHRDGFNEMIRLAKAGEANLILTKEVSRFSRNAKDTLNVAYELKDHNIGIYFINNRIYTGNEQGCRNLAAISSAAEDESYNISDRVKFGQRVQMKKGVTFGRREMFGYRIHKNEKKEETYEIIEEEAEVIRKIYEWFAAGDGTHRIARRLEEEGIPTFRYSNGWSNTVILRILRNEKYVGDLVQGKTYTPEMLTHKKKYQKDKAQWVKFPNHHTPIVERELWDKVQAILDEKAPSEEQKIKHSNRYWLSGKVFCGVCGGRYISNIKKKKTCVHKSWVCFEAHTRGVYKEDTVDGIPRGCNCGGMINDRVFKEIVNDLLTHFIKKQKDKLIEDTYKRQEQSIKPKKNNEAKIKQLDDKIYKLKTRLDNLYIDKLDGNCTQDEYNRFRTRFMNEIRDLELALQKEKEDEINEQKVKDDTENTIKRIEYLVSLTNDEFNDDLFARITKRIVVYPEHIIEVYIDGFTESFFFQFTAKGKLDTYQVKNTYFTREEAMEIIGDKIHNRVGVEKSIKNKKTKEKNSEE